METHPLKTLLVADDDEICRKLRALLCREAQCVEVAECVQSLGQAVLRLGAGRFDAVLFHVARPNAAAIFEITSLSVRARQTPVVVLGPAQDDTFLAEAVFGGAEDYLGLEHIAPEILCHAIQGSVARHQERLALTAEKENYHSLIDHLVEGVFRTNPEGRYLLANIALARIYGYDSPVDLMASIQDIGGSLYVDPSRRQEFVRLMQASDTLSGFESQIYRKDGTIIWIAENCRAIRDGQGKLLHYEGTVEDITERRRAEERIRQATEELSRSREELRLKSSLMEENLRTAREIQLALLPQQFPVFPPGCAPEKSAFQFVHRYEAAESVSGDFFTVSALSDTEASLFICDVTGHGIRAALVTAMIRALSEELKPLARDPGSFLRKLNADLCVILKNTGSPMLTTAIYAVADSRTGVLRFANAGHPKPLLVRQSAGCIELLANSSGRSQPALGLFEAPPYQTSEVNLAPGDLLMLFTDGLYEVQGQNEELYSQERLMFDVKNLLAQPPGPMFDQLLQNIRGFAHNGQFEDDVCLLGVSYSAEASQAEDLSWSELLLE